MTIDEASRRELWISLRNTIGDAQADTLMTMLPPQPLPELATREDVAAVTATLRAEIRAQGDALRAEWRGEFGELRGEFGELRGEFGELRGELGALRADIARQMLTLGLTLGSLIVAVVGTILSLAFTGAFG